MWMGWTLMGAINAHRRRFDWQALTSLTALARIHGIRMGPILR
jgi:hypothetical protein